MILAVTLMQFAAIAAVVVYLTVNMLHLVRLTPATEKAASAPFVSVCVPARNEARDIERCLNSLLNQAYPHFEVIAVNDHSTDGTGAILKALSARDDRLIAIEGAALPQGWLGKPFALHQAQAKAQGELLLFTDADLFFEPHALETAVQALTQRQVDLLTLMPGSQFVSFWERAVQPVVFGMIASLSRFRKINRPEFSSAVGFGAFLLFRRDAYAKIGGHASVRQEVVEDMMLAKRAKKMGLRLLAAEGKSLLSLRMYHSLGEIWRGWRKNLFIALKRSVPRTLYYAAVLLVFLTTPWLVLAANLTLGTSGLATAIAVAGVGLTLAASFKLCRELRMGLANALLFPLGAVVAAAIMLNSMAQALIWRRTEWRGRTYEA